MQVRGFNAVKTVGLEFPDVEATTRYDGSPVLKAAGCFMAGLASHPSAEPDTLVVRIDSDAGSTPAGCAADLLRDGLLSALSGRPGPIVATRSRRSSRLTLRFPATHVGKGTKTDLTSNACIGSWRLEVGDLIGSCGSGLGQPLAAEWV
jgi:hypothetical protein